MAKYDKVEEVAVEQSLPQPKITVQTPKVKAFSFEQWVQLRNKPERHMRGMRAFLGIRSGYKYPLQQWDEIFSSY